MQNKYKKRAAVNDAPTDNAKKVKKAVGITVIVVLSLIICALSVLLILEKTGVIYPKPSKDEVKIDVPAVADKNPRIEGEYLYVLLDDGTVMITGCTFGRETEKITVPSELGGYKVSAIGDSCFMLITSLGELVIPEGVTYIGKAFVSGTYNIKLYLPSTLSQIDKGAFEGCQSPDGIYFAGSREQWNKVKIGSGNDLLARVVISE